LMHFDPSGIGPFAFLDQLGLGAILAYFWDQEFGHPEAVRKLTRVSLWLGLPFTVLLFAAQYKQVQWLGMQWFTFPVFFDLALAFLFVWLVSRAAHSFTGPAGWFLEWKPVNYVGRISYGVYVVHAFMPVVLFYVLKWTHVSLPEIPFFRFLLLSAMSIAVASLSWHLMESPINRLKRYFEYERPANEPPAEAAEPLFANPYQDASAN
jgi:peptidoglycan/LPS O-acetylase OafA/YrhL